MATGWSPKPFRAVARDLEQAGFAAVRQKGSHVMFRREDRTIVVPNHGGKDLKPGTMRNIAKQAGISPEDLFGTGKARQRLELTPEEVNRGVADADVAPIWKEGAQRSAGRRGSVRHGRERDERSRRR